MTPALRVCIIVVLALLIAACVRMGHILQREPVRTMKFTGSHRVVAQCVLQRLGGKFQENRLNDSFVVYDAAKGMSSEGLTHWAITVGKYGPDEGFAEWRYVATPPTSGGYGAMPAETPLSETAVKKYWGTVEDCARQAKPAA